MIDFVQQHVNHFNQASAISTLQSSFKMTLLHIVKAMRMLVVGKDYKGIPKSEMSRRYACSRRRARAVYPAMYRLPKLET